MESYYTGDAGGDYYGTDGYGGSGATDYYGTKESKPVGEIGGDGLYTPIPRRVYKTGFVEDGYRGDGGSGFVEDGYSGTGGAGLSSSLYPDTVSTGLLETSFSPKESKPIPYTGGETRPEYGFALGMYDPYREQASDPYKHYLGGGIDFGTSIPSSFLSRTYSPTEQDFSSRDGNYSRGYKMVSPNKSLSPIEEMQMLKQKSLDSQLNNPELQRFALLQNNIKGLLNYGGR